MLENDLPGMTVGNPVTAQRKDAGECGQHPHRLEKLLPSPRRSKPFINAMIAEFFEAIVSDARICLA
jgi:hypothetical protein